MVSLIKHMQLADHISSICSTNPAHLGWRIWLITAASACSSRSTRSGSSSWPRFRSSAAVWVGRMSCKQS